MKWLSNFRENMQLRKERNTFENKYYTTQEKYVALLESKVDQTAELEKYKDLNPAIETAFIPETKYLPQLENAGALNELIKTYF